jgi:DNA anti-recombination protein RmuC
MRADNTRHIINAAHRRSQLTRAKAIKALRDLDATGEPISFQSVAEHAGVSRSWLYNQPDLRTEIERLRATRRRALATRTPINQRASDASLLRRLETANQRLRQLREDNRRLREQVARLLGEQRGTTNASFNTPKPSSPGPPSH